jgi:flavodoxin
MNSPVVYFSQSGQTEKVARAIAEALPGDVACNAMADAPSVDEADVVFVGLPIVRFGPPEAVQRFLAERCAGKRVALFITHAAAEDEPVLQEWLGACREAAAGTRLVGTFDCQGELAEPVRQAMIASGMPRLVQFAEMADQAKGMPDAPRLQAARRFAAEVAAGSAAEAAATV